MEKSNDLTDIYIKNHNLNIANIMRVYSKAKKIRLLLACNMDQIEYIVKQVKNNYCFGMVIICNTKPISVREITKEYDAFEDISQYSPPKVIIPIKRLLQQRVNYANKEKTDAFCVYALLEVLPNVQIPSEKIIQSICSGLSNAIVPNGLHQTADGSWFFMFAEKNAIDRQTSKKVGLFCNGAYGDLVMMIPIIQALIRREKAYEREVEIFASKDFIYNFLKIFISDANIINLNSLSCLHQSSLLYDALKNSGQYCYLLNFPDIQYNEKIKNRHIFDIWMEEFGLSDSKEIFSRADFNGVKPDPSIEDFLYEVKNKYKWIVGFQYFSNTLKVNGQYTRAWPYEFAVDFVKQCHENKIGVLSLVPDERELLPDVYSVGHLPIKSLFQVIYALDAVVSIDSICGHIAGVMGTPNITINGNYVSILQNKYSYRPLSMNYSLYSNSGYPSDIPADIVFSRLMSILKGEISLQKNIIRYEDSLKGVGIEWIGEK